MKVFYICEQDSYDQTRRNFGWRTVDTFTDLPAEVLSVVGNSWQEIKQDSETLTGKKIQINKPATSLFGEQHYIVWGTSKEKVMEKYCKDTFQ